ncbi:MAG: hypothetical protein KDD94_02440 [Calditrichaeota bacterium]|nr:hypothetical protein [Calditrichota bacterium]
MTSSNYRFFGSSKSKIVHDLSNQKKKCQIAKISEHNGIYFAEIENALKDDFHLCSSCLFNYIENYHSTFTHILSTGHIE